MATGTIKQNAQETALGLGRSILQHIARELRSRSEPCFEQDGSPTDGTDGAMLELASDGLNEWLELALLDGWLNRTVVNQTREELGLDPLA
jgi:hypothetical protein